MSSDFCVIPGAEAFEINRNGDVRRRLPARTSRVGHVSSGGRMANLTHGGKVVVKTRRELVKKAFGETWPSRIVKGEQVHTAKLKERDVLEIRAWYASGQSMRSLAKEYGVCLSNIKCIIWRKSWKHVD